MRLWNARGERIPQRIKVDGGSKTMQIAVAITLTVLYVGLSLMLGGVPPKNGFPWWFFAPCIVTFCTALVAKGIMAILPIPWVNGRRYGSPPRRVHLSWRAAVRLPVYVPALLIPWYFLSILRMHFDLDWVLSLVVTLAMVILAFVCLLYTSPSPRDRTRSRMPSSA